MEMKRKDYSSSIDRSIVAAERKMSFQDMAQSLFSIGAILEAHFIFLSCHPALLVLKKTPYK